MIAPPPPPAVARHSSDGDDSDSDWDDDDDDFARKINIQIKPVAPVQISASVDELRATVGKWTSMVNLVKPNSRRHQTSNSGNSNNNNNTSSSNNNNVIRPAPSVPNCNNANLENVVVPKASCPTVAPKVPVAFAVQECLNVRMLMSPEGDCLTSLVGHIKMALPRQFQALPLAQNGSLDDSNTISRASGCNLCLNVFYSKPWETLNFNENLVNEPQEAPATPFDETSNYNQFNDSFKKLSVDMKAAYEIAKQLKNHLPSDCNYILLPELLSYTIITNRSQHELPGSEMFNPHQEPSLSPIQAVSHWLCDLNVTKVRVDLEFFGNIINDKFGDETLTTDDIKNIKISLQVSGGVESFQSKPEATWSSIDSKLTWSFPNLTELIRNSTTFDGITSCLAKFILNDGPSKQSETSLQFSIAGKTLSGTRIELDKSSNSSYLIARQKHEVRTGTFSCCPPPCL